MKQLVYRKIKCFAKVFGKKKDAAQTGHSNGNNNMNFKDRHYKTGFTSV